jgi:hypothetical protein
MSPKNLFRCLVAISLATGFAALGATQLPGDYPEEWRALYEWSGNGSLFHGLGENRWLLLGVGVPLAIFAIAAQVGMFLFWPFARPAYAAIVAAMVLVTAFAGLVVQLPVEAALMEISVLADGAIIALSYSQPFSSYFESSRS